MQKNIVRALTTSVLIEVAEDEVYLVEGYFPDLTMRGKTAQGPQGLGVEIAITLALPILYSFFNKLIELLAENAASHIATLLKQWLRGDEISSHDLLKLIRNELQQAGIEAGKLDSTAAAVLKAIEGHKDQLSEHVGR